MKNKIYILSKSDFLRSDDKSLVRTFVKLLSRPWTVRSFYTRIFGGHWGVSKCIFLGLVRARLPFKINTPIGRIPPGGLILLLSGVGEIPALLSRRDLKIVVGPNFTSEYEEHKHFFSQPHVEKLLVPSLWISSYITNPDYKDKIRVWSVGVEVPRFLKHLNRHRKTGKVLVYLKVELEDIFSEVTELVKNLGKVPIVLKYGSHTRLSYLLHLVRSEVMIYVGATESQGLALQEAWSLSKPTFVFKRDAKTIPWLEQPVPDFCLSPFAAPYLSDVCGGFWRDTGELRDLLNSRFEFAEVPRSLPKSYKESAFSLWRLIFND